MKMKSTWKLYSGADWTLNELATVITYALAFIGVGVFLGWFLNVG